MFTERAMSTDSITLIENIEVTSSDQEVAEIFKFYFGNAVKNLDI